PSTAAEAEFCGANPNLCRRRFDRNRKDLFHDMLFAHATGIGKSSHPCLNGTTPTDWGAGTPLVCAAGDSPNPEFHVPTSFSGKADLPGGDAMVTLGLWDRKKFTAS